MCVGFYGSQASHYVAWWIIFWKFTSLRLVRIWEVAWKPTSLLKAPGLVSSGMTLQNIIFRTNCSTDP